MLGYHAQKIGILGTTYAPTKKQRKEKLINSFVISFKRKRENWSQAEITISRITELWHVDMVLTVRTY